MGIAPWERSTSAWHAGPTTPRTCSAPCRVTSGSPRTLRRQTRSLRAAREAEAMAAELLGRVHGPRRRVLGALLRRVRANAGAREYPKFQVIRLFAKGRALLALVGADLASRGSLSSADDVWYLTVAEM